MSRRSPNSRPPSGHSISNSSPLISVSTITYIASWRGQLLICTVILVIGAIYFVIRQPISDYLRRRREEISRARQQELMKLDKEKEELEAVAEKEKIKVRAAKEKEKKKEKDLRRRKGSLLRVSNVDGGSGTESSPAGPSSLESSPAPAPERLGVPTSTNKTPNRSRSRSPSPSPISALSRLPPSTPEPRRVSASAPRIRLREPTSESIVVTKEVDVDQTPKSAKSVKSTKPHAQPNSGQTKLGAKNVNKVLEDRSGLLPEQIPLPGSPDLSPAGPSRIGLPSSDTGDMSDTTSNASEHPSSARPTTWMKSEGYSIMPDKSYLPPQNPVGGSKDKKKKKKPRQSQPEPPSVLVPSKHEAPSQSPEPSPNHRGHLRQDSFQICRPVNASSEEYEAHMDRMEVVIDRLRGELGAANSSGRKASEAEEEAKQREAKMRTELEKMSVRTRSSEKIRNREAELCQYLDDARRHAVGLTKRIADLEAYIASNGGPPPSPFMPMGPPSPFPQMNGHGMFGGNMSPMPPGSPFNMAFPSPGMGGPSRGNIPHHQMYPSPLLHPNAHALLLNAANSVNMNMMDTTMKGNGNGHGLHPKTPSQFRRTSNADSSNDVFAGPLTPGIPSSTTSPYPYELGHGLPPIPMHLAPALEGDGLPAVMESNMTPQERRTSIEASVMRKKSGHLTSQQDSQDSQEVPEAIQEEKEEVIGLGMGDVEQSTNGQEDQQVEDGQNGQEENGNGDEHNDEDLRSSLSPPNHFGHSNSSSNFNSSNPPTPSPQSRLLTPSHLAHESLANETPSTPSNKPVYDQVKIKHDDTSSSASVSHSEGGTNVTRPPSPDSPLWASELTEGQIAQRKHLAAMREMKEATRLALENATAKVRETADQKPGEEGD